MTPDNVVEGALSAPNTQDISAENRREITPAQRQGIGPSAADMLAQLRASGLSLADIEVTNDIGKRTMEDIQYGRSSGARIVSQLRPLFDALQQKHQERRAITQIRDQARMQVTAARAPQLMAQARAVADMEVAAYEREQDVRLYRAALNYLGPKWQALSMWQGDTPVWRQMVIQEAQAEREREQRLLDVSAWYAGMPAASPFSRLFGRREAPKIEVSAAPQRGQIRPIAPPAGYVPYTPPASPLPRRALGDGLTVPDGDELPPWLR